jgi:6-phosphogluconate dehydrogenase
MDLGVPIPVIDMAVCMRELSAYKEERILAAALYKMPPTDIAVPQEVFIQQVEDALYFAMIISYAQGLAQLHIASKELNMDIPMQDVVKVWRGGCIIRSSLLPIFFKAYEKNNQLPNLLLEPEIVQLLQGKRQNLRNVIIHAVHLGYPVAGLMSALSYFDAYRSERMPTNLIQAQRDYFGAHTYQRIDEPGTFHTEWNK